MKRKEPLTGRERRIYYIIGFLAFPVVNIPLAIIIWRTLGSIDPESLTPVLALPWVVNGVAILLAFLLHPEFGVGYLMSIAVAVSLVTALGVLFVAACFVSILSSAILGNLAVLLFAVLMLVGLYGLARFAIDVFRNWWSSYKNSLQ